MTSFPLLAVFKLTDLSLQTDDLSFQIPSLDDSTISIHDYIADPDCKYDEGNVDNGVNVLSQCLYHSTKMNDTNEKFLYGKVMVLFPYMPCTAKDPLIGGKLLHTHGTSGVELVRTYSDFSAETENSAIAEAGGCIHHDDG